MKTILTHNTALEFWCPQDVALTHCAVEPARIISHNDCASRLGDILRFDLPAFARRSACLHVLVFDAEDRRYSARHTCHVWQGPLPQNAFYRLNNGVYLVSPEFCFVQMAPQLGFIEAVRLGYYLTGSFVLTPRVKQGFIERQPVTTAAALRSFAESVRDQRGAASALKAIAYVADGAASPMEVDLAIRLCLPTAKGGYGFPLPTLNKHVDLPSNLRRVLGKDYYSIDFYWEQGNVGIEYDSDAFHTGGDRITHDAVRRNTLNSLGIRIITVTRQQYFGADGMDSVANELDQALGRRRRISSARTSQLRAALGKSLKERFDNLPAQDV